MYLLYLAAHRTVKLCQRKFPPAVLAGIIAHLHFLTKLFKCRSLCKVFFFLVRPQWVTESTAGKTQTDQNEKFSPLTQMLLNSEDCAERVWDGASRTSSVSRTRGNETERGERGTQRLNGGERARGGYGRLGKGHRARSFCISAPHNGLYIAQHRRHRELNPSFHFVFQLRFRLSFSFSLLVSFSLSPS